MEQGFRRYCDFQLTSILLLEFIISAAFLWPSAFLEALDEADGLEQFNTSSENRSRQFTIRPVPTKFVSVPHWRSRITSKILREKFDRKERRIPVRIGLKVSQSVHLRYVISRKDEVMR
jgi:hypothetical protein